MINLLDLLPVSYACFVLALSMINKLKMNIHCGD